MGKSLHVLLLAAGLACLVLMLLRVGPAKVWHGLSSLGWGLVPLVLVEGLGEVFHTAGWSRCLSESARARGFVRLFWMRLAGSAINYFTPTAALGGEMTRATLVAEAGGMAEATTGVLIDKVCMALAHLLLVLAGAGAILARARLPRALETAMLLTAAAMTAGIVHADAPAVVVAGIWAIGLWFDLLVFIVPMSLGTLEASRVATFAAVGYPAAQGMTYGMVLRLGQWTWAVLGLGAYAILAWHRPAMPLPRADPQ